MDILQQVVHHTCTLLGLCEKEGWLERGGESVMSCSAATNKLFGSPLHCVWCGVRWTVMYCALCCRDAARSGEIRE